MPFNKEKLTKKMSSRVTSDMGIIGLPSLIYQLRAKTEDTIEGSQAMEPK